MNPLKTLIALLTVACTILFAVGGNYFASAATLFLVGNALAPQSAKLCVTLTTSEVLMDIIGAFFKSVPAINRMGSEWTGKVLKRAQTYIAHIAAMPTVGRHDDTLGYAITGTGYNEARGLLTDVAITIDTHVVCRLNWKHLDMIKDNKIKYDEVIALAGLAMAQDFFTSIAQGFTTQNFSHSTTAAAADFDLDVITDICGKMTLQRATPIGRTLLVNTDVANVISLDSRVASNQFYNQRPDGNALRRWTGLGGFAEIIEYPELPTNNGDAQAVTIATTDIVSATAHGYSNGDPVVFASLAGGAGLTDGTKYYVRDVTANTFKVSATVGGAAVDVTTAYTSGTVALKENLIGFAFDRRAIATMSGIPADFNGEALGLNIPRGMGFEAVTAPDGGFTMGAVSWQTLGTGDLNWVPTFVFGKALGRQGYANGADALTDRAGHRIISA